MLSSCTRSSSYDIKRSYSTSSSSCSTLLTTRPRTPIQYCLWIAIFLFALQILSAFVFQTSLLPASLSSTSVKRRSIPYLRSNEHATPIEYDADDTREKFAPVPSPIDPSSPITTTISSFFTPSHPITPFRLPSIAFVIPVGGRTERSANLKVMLDTLYKGGASPQDMFIFEDVLSRNGQKPSELVAKTVEQWNMEVHSSQEHQSDPTSPDAGGHHPSIPLPTTNLVKIIPSYVNRSDTEDHTNFGIHLARHYMYMLDYILIGETEVQLKERKERMQNEEATEKIGLNGAKLKSSQHLRALTTPPYDYIVILEDDLFLSPDIVKYFTQMSRVMEIDDSLYCVAAHQDNAYFATSDEMVNVPKRFGKKEKLRQYGIYGDGAMTTAATASSFEQHAHPSLDPQQFSFRRGNHFMAPGWMTSRSIYTQVVKKWWLDPVSLQYTYAETLHLKNGHWDRFFDSLIGERDCIFPEVPRITHEGADGFTVSKKGQMELYTGLRLSKLPVDTLYADLRRMTFMGYAREVEQFIADSIILTVPEQSLFYRHAKLVYEVPARDQKDNEWNAVIVQYFGLIGVGGYGGYEGYVKVRGIWQGVVFVRWMTNLVMLVGEYSEFMQDVEERKKVMVRSGPTTTFTTNDHLLPLTSSNLEYHHCLGLDFVSRPHTIIPHFTRASISPLKCVTSCYMKGYEYAGVVNTRGCLCLEKSEAQTSPTHHNILPRESCDYPCLGSSAHSTIGATWKKGVSAILGEKQPCGGSQAVAVWSITPPSSTFPAASSNLLPPSDVIFLRGDIGQSCSDVCENGVGGTDSSTLVCDEQYFPLLLDSCSKLRSLMGCTLCEDEPAIERAFSTPGRVSDSSQMCKLSRGKHITCAMKPEGEFRRACVCRKVTPVTVKVSQKT